MLTPKLRETLMFIGAYAAQRGVTPSFQEMADGLHLASKGSIHRRIKLLEDRGFVRCLSRKSRALEILKMPEPASIDHFGDRIALTANDRRSLALMDIATARTALEMGDYTSAFAYIDNALKHVRELTGRGDRANPSRNNNR